MDFQRVPKTSAGTLVDSPFTKYFRRGLSTCTASGTSLRLLSWPPVLAETTLLGTHDRVGVDLLTPYFSIRSI